MYLGRPCGPVLEYQRPASQDRTPTPGVAHRSIPRVKYYKETLFAEATDWRKACRCQSEVTTRQRACVNQLVVVVVACGVQQSTLSWPQAMTFPGARLNAENRRKLGGWREGFVSPPPVFES
jgi:hypothetical protein